MLINDISKGLDTNKISASKECNICPYWYFFQLNDLIFNLISAMGAMMCDVYEPQ